MRTNDKVESIDAYVLEYKVEHIFFSKSIEIDTRPVPLPKAMPQKQA